MEFERRRHGHTHINMAPLVDVVFLLLLFFMLTSHLVQNPAIKVNLPESKTAVSEEESVKTISITGEGKIFFMDSQVDLKRLQATIRKSLTDTEKVSLRIRADRNASVGLLMRVIDKVKLSGIRNFGIVTERR